MNNEAFRYYARLQKVKHLVEEHYSEKISLQRAASLACMERTSFSRFFSNKVGISFTQWLRQIRISKAMDLMKKNNATIGEVTHAVGFSNLRDLPKGIQETHRFDTFTIQKQGSPFLVPNLPHLGKILSSSCQKLS